MIYMDLPIENGDFPQFFVGLEDFHMIFSGSRASPGVVPGGFQGQFAHRGDASTKDQQLSTDVFHRLKVAESLAEDLSKVTAFFVGKIVKRLL